MSSAASCAAGDPQPSLRNRRRMSSRSFTLTDPATGKSSELPVKTGTIGPAVLDIAAINKDHGVFTFDPAFGVTASCESKITYIDGDAGVLLYRGYPI
jgi:citrate synthase